MPRWPARRQQRVAPARKHRGSGAPARWASTVSRLDMPEVLRLLDEPGCVLCRIRDEAGQVWLRWFVIENHSVPAALFAAQRSAGYCPAHTRRLVAEGGPQVLRMPWEFVLRTAVRRAGSLAAAQKPEPRQTCPPCQAAAERTGPAAHDLAAALGIPGVPEAVRARHGLCYPHLREMLPTLGPASAVAVADAVAPALTGRGDPNQLLLAAAGSDPDAEHRAAVAVAAAATDTGGEWLGLPAAGRLVADLAAGSCPCCRAESRAERWYLGWLAGERASGHGKSGPDGSDAEVCSRHLHDVARLGEPAAWVSDAAVRSVAGRVARLAAAARKLADGQRRATPGRWPGGRRGAPTNLAEAYGRAFAEVRNDHRCRACRAAESARRRQLALLAACTADARVLDALRTAHGVCLRHGEQLAGMDGTGPFLRRLLTQLRQAAWELDEDAAKQAWDLRHEPDGREATAWRRIPTLLDGASYLGAAEHELWPADAGRSGGAFAGRGCVPEPEPGRALPAGE